MKVHMVETNTLEEAVLFLLKENDAVVDELVSLHKKNKRLVFSVFCLSLGVYFLNRKMRKQALRIKDLESRADIQAKEDAAGD